MVQRHHVSGYENFCEFIAKLETTSNNIIVWFSGSDMEDGVSWCSDCVDAHPFIESALEKYGTDDMHFVHVEVGDRPTWKDPNCAFRKDAKIRLSVLPTVLKWKTPQKLEGVQCENDNLLEMLLTED